MWSFFEKLLGILAALVSSLIAYKKGRSDVQEAQKDEVLEDVAFSQKVDQEAKLSYADADKRKRLRDRNTAR